MATYRLSEASLSAKTYPPPRNVICEWCRDWTDAVVRVPPQLTRLSGLTAEQVIERWPDLTEWVGDHERTCPERERLGDWPAILVLGTEE